MSGRARLVLGRFPAHMEASRPGKQLGAVAEALADDLDVLSAELAGVRRAHRLGEAETLTDLLRVSALPGLQREEIRLLLRRFQRARARLGTLREAIAAGDEAARGEAAEALFRLWGLDEPAPRLPLFSPPPGGASAPDPAATAALHAGRAVSYASLLDAVRRQTGGTADIHASGNGTVRALIAGAAGAMDLEVVELVHSPDRFWHAARVRDRAALTRPPQAGTRPASPQRLAPADEVIGLEENPLVRQETGNDGRAHAELFSVLRRGFDRVLLEVRVTGHENRTVGPMLVNRDEGRGIGFAGAVEPGRTLVFTEHGRVLLEGSDVTPRAYAWEGGCFGASDASAEWDFVFGDADAPTQPGRVARFATTTPPGALDVDATFPHSGIDVPTPGLQVGETRFAFFVQVAHFSLRREPPAPLRRVVPRPAVGFFDGSVFATAAGEQPPVAAEVQLRWLEHEAYAVRLLIPPRFREMEDEEAPVAELVHAAIQRFKPAGVAVRVEYVDERWVLGEGLVLDETATDPIRRLRSGTVLWAAPTADR